MSDVDSVDVYQITLPYACFGIFVNTETTDIVRAAPIGMWMVGMHLEDIIKWVSKKNGTINKLDI
jgi:hypothetical protein